MKKFIALLLALTMLAALTACGSKTEPAKAPETTAAPAKTEETAAPATEAPSFTLPGDVEYVVPFSAGGGSDLYSRTAANIMTENNLLGGRAVTVTNKPGLSLIHI